MYSIDDTVKALALAPARHIYSRAIFGTKSGNTWDNDRTYSDTDHIISAKISIGSGSGGLTIGGAYSAKLTLQLMGGVTVNQTDRIIMRVGFYNSDGTKSDPIGLGWFYVDTITRKDNITTIVAYDKMLRGAKIYKPTALTFPCRASAILDDICDKMGISLRDGVAMPYDPIINEAPTKGKDSDGNTLYYTRREILGYLASIMGGNWFFDAGGHLAFTQFAAVSDTFAAANSTAADISSDAYAVTGITWNINGVPYSRFDDTDAAGMLEFSNPLKVDAKEPIMGAVEQRLIGLAYHGGTIQRQGCGWFELGDIVTAYRKDGTSAPVLITGINYSIENGAFTEKILSSALSESESNYTSGDITGQTVPQSVAQEEALNVSGAVISEYEYLSDTSVKFNDITYTVEKDSTTGLIAKISDSNGNSFEPTINSGIADVSLHNAVFWAVAMARGFGKPGVLPVSDGITDYFDCNLGVSGELWKNQISGGNDISLVGAELQSDGSVGVYGTSSSYGLLTSPAPESGARSLYLAFKTATVGVIKRNVHTIGAAVSPVSTGSWFGLGADGYMGGSFIQSDQFMIAIDSNIASTSYHVVVLTRSAGGLNTLYIDGTAIGTMSNSVKYGNTLGIGLIALDGNPQGSTSVLQQIKGIVVASACHDSEQVAQNTAWLKKHHGI